MSNTCENKCRCGKTVVTEQTVESTSDERTVNNAMRHQYRVLTDIEKEQMQNIKDKGLDLLHAINEIGGDRRELELARQKTEEAVMWACKYVTK